MEIYRISCFVMLIMMIISGALLIVFPRLRHKESFYMQMLNNLNVGFFSGLMVSASVALVSYFYAKEDFLADLFQQSRYIYNNLTIIKTEIEKAEPSDYTNLPALLYNIEKSTAAIEQDAKQVNFLNFSPFFPESEMAKQVKTVQNLYYDFLKYPAFFTRMKVLQDEQKKAEENFDYAALKIAKKDISMFMDDLKNVVGNNLETLHGFISKLKQENQDRYIPWESFKAIPVTLSPHRSEKNNDKEEQKPDNKNYDTLRRNEKL